MLLLPKDSGQERQSLKGVQLGLRNTLRAHHYGRMCPDWWARRYAHAPPLRGYALFLNFNALTLPKN